MNIRFQPSRRIFLGGMISLLAGCKTGSKSRVDTSSVGCKTPHGTKPVRVIELLIDHTTYFPDPFINKFVDNLKKFVRPGDRVRIAKFGGANPNTVPEEVVIGGGSDRWRDSPQTVKQAAACEKHTWDALAKIVRSALTQHDPHPPSPIFESLMLYSLAAREADTPHMLVLCSDGVQYSDKLRFIAGNGASGTLALPSAEELTDRLGRIGLIPSSLPPVVHFGLGLPEGPAKTHSARSSSDIILLKKLWQAYYSAARAPYGEIGTPYPSRGIQSVKM